MLDRSGDFRQQMAAGQVTVLIIHPLEVVEVDKDQTKRQMKAAGAFELDLGNRKQMPRIEKTSAVIRYGQFLNALHRADVLNSDRSKVAEHPEKRHRLIGEGRHTI